MTKIQDLFKKAGLEKFSIEELRGKTIKITPKAFILGKYFMLCCGVTGASTDGYSDITLSLNKTYLVGQNNKYAEKVSYNEIYGTWIFFY